MKKLLTSVLLAIMIISCLPVNAFAISTVEEAEIEIAEHTERQHTAHMMAEAARALGYAEDYPIIIEAKNIWGDSAQKKEALLKVIEELSKPKLKYFGEFKLTSYCPCIKCCGKTDGITYSGVKAVEGVTIAADIRKLPIGTKVYIDGLGERVVQDIGGAIKGNKIDVFFDKHSDCYNSIANRSGVKVWIIEE